MLRLFIIPLAFGACQCAPPTVITKKVVSVTTEIVYQVDEDNERAVHATFQGRADQYHNDRVDTVHNRKKGKRSRPKSKKSEPTPEPTVPEGSNCTSYAYSKSHVHVENSFSKGQDTQKEEATSDNTTVVCLY